MSASDKLRPPHTCGILRDFVMGPCAACAASDEPHVVTRTQVEQERDAYKALAGECPNEPLFFVLAAVLAEVARRKQPGAELWYKVLGQSHYSCAIDDAANAIAELLRLKAEGAT